ncbi:cation diffusion facilitator family transporter [Paenibacillus sp. 1182]|uniref:cation diffusion facilitator family transporter n=1 Tax=Paenibacillus sp. 1182 TaxID=2806565 RepID=UPI001AEAFDCB|nr:cation diffusion facilitator family transporter [Paenibacillus sp. 1182]MBP1308757.1 cation diffusion facilitator family transporter [Paenibacillus sp. 1182]
MNEQKKVHEHMHLATCNHTTHDPDHVMKNKKGLRVAFLITLGIVGVEFMGSWISNSLSLLSDAGHMVGDLASLLLSMIAIYLSHRATTKINGYSRFEIAASLFNGVTLIVLSGWVIWQAFCRLQEPQHVQGDLLVVVAIVGLIANLCSAWYMSQISDVSSNLNVRSAYLHVLMDAWSSVGVIIFSKVDVD